MMGGRDIELATVENEQKDAHNIMSDLLVDKIIAGKGIIIVIVVCTSNK
jgi:hypothetical protein